MRQYFKPLRPGRVRVPGGSTIEAPEHYIWRGMIARCHSVKRKDYHKYGGRGISVCNVWRKSYALFLEDVGPRPSTKHQIDRIDTLGNYEPGNCRWVTSKENNSNRRDTHFIEANGERLCIAAWAERLGTFRSTIFSRIYLRGWDPVVAVTTKPRYMGRGGLRKCLVSE